VTTSPVDTTTMQVLTTVLSLDFDHPVTRAAMRDGHLAHRLTMSGFAHLLPQHDFFTGIARGHADHRSSLNILFAASVRPNGTVMLRIQSDRAPDFTHHACDYWRGAIDPSTPPVTRNWTVPATGDVRYQIRANPTVTSNGRRRALNGVRDQIDWWTHQARCAGLELAPAALTIDDPVTFEFPSKHRTNGANASRWVMPTQRYSGAATIADPRAHRDAVIRGIGRGRPYGAGLLLTMAA
jgi:CRISPR system Cascade subunit CasE